MYEDYSSLLESTWLEEYKDEITCIESVREYLSFLRNAIADYDYSQYGEYHHVIPRCIDKHGKYSDQTIKISPYNHFLAHCKLVDCLDYKDFKYRLTCAVERMYPRVKESDTLEYLAREYQKAKEIRSSLQRVRLTGRKLPKETIDRMKESQRKRYENPDMKKQLSLAHKGYKFSEEAIESMRRANKGSNNPMYGTHYRWMNNGIHNRRVKPEEIETYLLMNYSFGRIKQ